MELYWHKINSPHTVGDPGFGKKRVKLSIIMKSICIAMYQAEVVPSKIATS